MKKKGFTLIELLIVIGILSVLAAGMLVLLNPAEQVKKANDARRKSDLAQVKRALESYYQDNGRYPVSNGSGQIVGSTAISWGGSWVPYMTVVPKDPSPSFSYYYYSDSISNNQSFYLYATLERATADSQTCNPSGTTCSSVGTKKSGTFCPGTNGCNYGVTSPDTSP